MSSSDDDSTLNTDAYDPSDGALDVGSRFIGFSNVDDLSKMPSITFRPFAFAGAIIAGIVLAIWNGIIDLQQSVTDAALMLIGGVTSTLTKIADLVTLDGAVAEGNLAALSFVVQTGPLGFVAGVAIGALTMGILSWGVTQVVE